MGLTCICIILKLHTVARVPSFPTYCSPIKLVFVTEWGGLSAYLPPSLWSGVNFLSLLPPYPIKGLMGVVEWDEHPPNLAYVHTDIHGTLSYTNPTPGSSSLLPLLPNFTDYPFYLLTSGPTTGTFHLQLSSYQFKYASSAFHKFVPSLPMPSLHPRSINISTQSRFFHSLCLPGPKQSDIQLLSRTYQEQAQNIPNWNELPFLPSNPRPAPNLT